MLRGDEDAYTFKTYVCVCVYNNTEVDLTSFIKDILLKLNVISTTKMHFSSVILTKFVWLFEKPKHFPNTFDSEQYLELLDTFTSILIYLYLT